MQTSPVSTLERFETALSNLEVGITYAGPDEFHTVLESIVDDPTIGVPLGFDAISLPPWVDTDPTPATLESATTGITPASMGIADYGSVVLPEQPAGAEPVSLFPDRHVAVVRASDVVTDMRTAIDRLGPRLRAGESTVVATGPSATADMGALVRGAHGPKTVHVVVFEDGRMEGDDE